ncbi:hypothetical protein PGN35_003940 [Nodosilinea sp. PGN35]|uniref:hypothetical protein n=1 Tax=Nodosilinea sp. PGN35 TaxID=3020489 RepID=UPI0023B2C88D|nr:hypothetical protein [Nodosilinea sp. TSF1-S3]MDF0365770.1 hypothetical protein [Nodosilinea sp. TSF1-S3]
MNAPVDHAHVQVAALAAGAAPEPTAALATVAPAARETTPAADRKIGCLEVRQTPYPPDQQVELLHLQAEAEALLLQLQAKHQRRQRHLEGAVETPAV